MKKFLWFGLIVLWGGGVGFLEAQSPAPVATTYQFPFWSDGDVDSGEKPFHIGYRTGLVITNPSGVPITVELNFLDSEGRSVAPVLSDGSGLTRVIPGRASINLTTPAAWRSPQRFGYVTATGDAKFFMTVQVELVHIPNPALPPPAAQDPRISVMRIEAAKSTAEVLISWERSATTDTAFVIANTTSQAVVGTVTGYSGVKPSQTFKELFIGGNSSVIRTVADFDALPSLLDPAVSRSHGYIKVEFPAGVIVTGVTFRVVQDPILLPAPIATP